MSKILAFGEIMMRLAPPKGVGIAESNLFEACYGGTEANVLACLSNFGHQTQYLSALPKGELGNAVINHLHGFGVDTSKVLVQGDTLGIYFVEDGTGSRGSNVVYMRKNSEIAKLDENSFRYDKVFSDVSLFHVSGISFALSDSCRRLAFRLLEEARKRNVTVSFDFNYRSKLWTVEQARECFLQIIDKVDVVLASPLDLSVFLQVSEKDYFSKYNNRYLVLRNRQVVSATKHKVQVTVYGNVDGKTEVYRSQERQFDVVEKIGGGDAFNGAMLHALTSGKNLQQATEFAIAAFIMKHSISGDTFTKTEAEVLSFADKSGVSI